MPSTVKLASTAAAPIIPAESLVIGASAVPTTVLPIVNSGMPPTLISEPEPVVVDPSTRREPKESVTMLALIPAALSDASALIESRTDCNVAPLSMVRLYVEVPCWMVSGPAVIELVTPFLKAAVVTFEEVAIFWTSMA
ncbi:hypothetical protein D3C76_1194980 [compost metagenome]